MIVRSILSLRLSVDKSLWNPLVFCIHLVVCLWIMAALLNIVVTCMSRSDGMEMPLFLATSDSVWMHCSTFFLCS